MWREMQRTRHNWRNIFSFLTIHSVFSIHYIFIVCIVFLFTSILIQIVPTTHPTSSSISFYLLSRNFGRIFPKCPTFYISDRLRLSAQQRIKIGTNIKAQKNKLILWFLTKIFINIIVFSCTPILNYVKKQVFWSSI